MATVVREEAKTTDLWRMSATDLAEAIRSRQTSGQEVVEMPFASKRSDV